VRGEQFAPSSLIWVKLLHSSHPRQASFKEALEFIQRERRTCDYCLVALDQPTIVPNTTGCRPVDRVAGSLIGFIGGGVQPANRSRVGMFDDGAPIWRFKRDLGATEDPEVSRKAQHGIFIVEVFPALALPVFAVAFNAYHQALNIIQRERRFGYKIGML
jgi:predicted RNase H-like nuclease